MNIALIGGTLVTPFRQIENGGLVIRDGQIISLGVASEIEIPDNTKVIDVSGRMVTPGFVDLLCHGGGGYGFADTNEESFIKISKYFLSRGSTTILPSLHAKPHDQLIADMKTLASFIKSGQAPNFFGIHMEGPYLNKELKGAMNEDYLWTPSIESWNELYEASEGLIKIMTIAPELPGALEVMNDAAKKGVVLSIGHSKANYDQILLAIDNGANHVTHMFNAMNPFHHRKPGVVLQALMRDELKVELIADKLHVHPAVMELLLRLKGASGIILITDSIRAGGMHAGEYQFADQKVTIKDEKVYMDDGTLAGSALTLNKAIKNMIQTANAKLTESVRMASLNGAKVVGAKNRGILAVGKKADIVVMDDNFDVEMTMINGKIEYQRENE